MATLMIGAQKGAIMFAGVLYGAWMHSRADGVSGHEALTLCMGALAKVVAL